MQVTREYIYNADIVKTVEMTCLALAEDAASHPACHVIENEKSADGTIRFTTEIRIGELPESLSKLLKAETFSWRETSIWNPEKKEWVFESFNRFSPKYFRCLGRLFYVADGNDKTRVKYDVTLEIKLPLLGKTLEAIVADRMKANWDRQHEGMRKKLLNNVYHQRI
jgi:hypothetical protein